MASNLPIAATRVPELDRSETLAAFFQGLADPTRVRILELLAVSPSTVTQLRAALGIGQGRVSSHLACLRWCGYVAMEPDGRFSRYRLIDDRIRQILRLGELTIADNGSRLAPCLVLATEPGGERAGQTATPGGVEVSSEAS